MMVETLEQSLIAKKRNSPKKEEPAIKLRRELKLASQAPLQQEKRTRRVSASKEKSPQPLQENSIVGASYKLFPNAPTLEKKDFITDSGRHVDFTAANSLPALVNLLREVGEVKNNLGQSLEADTLVNLIYEYIYTPNPDWTKITLRHRLREAVYFAVETYKKTPEYLHNLGQVGLLKVNTLQELEAEILKKSTWALPNGRVVGSQTIVDLVDKGFVTELPSFLREKVIALNKQAVYNSPPKKTGWFSRVKSWFSK